jgi:putative heme-binding domain-containing protein
VAKVPEAERTTPAVLDSLQFGDALAGLLPKDDAKKARKALGELGVRVIRVGTLTDQMLYDKDRIVVQAGKPVEFVFENTDIMPHNRAVVLPGALQEVGDAAEVFGTQPGAQDKDFIPPSAKILLKSKLLQPQTSQVIRFNVPKEPGVYPYVCTYPGHWRRMHGALYVVADLDAYTEEPEKYVAANKLEPKDELLKFNRPRTEWKLEELTPALAELDNGGRSFARGKQIFNVASCVGCHKFDGGGKEFGPDLTKLDEKEFKRPADLLKHILQPSLRIEDKYRTYKFDLLDGGSVSGMLVEPAKDGVYKVIENPLLKAEPKVIKEADLGGAPKKSDTSIMPKGLLDKLTKDEILDLVAYVWAKADPKSKFFDGGDHKHGHGGGH